MEDNVEKELKRINDKEIIALRICCIGIIVLVICLITAVAFERRALNNIIAQTDKCTFTDSDGNTSVYNCKYDVNNDGVVDLEDASKITNFYLGRSK